MIYTTIESEMSIHYHNTRQQLHVITIIKNCLQLDIVLYVAYQRLIRPAKRKFENNVC